MAWRRRGRPRKAQAHAIRQRGARQQHAGPTPEMARILLALAGTISPVQAWGMVALPANDPVLTAWRATPRRSEALSPALQALRAGASLDDVPVSPALARARREGRITAAREAAFLARADELPAVPVPSRLPDGEIMRLWWQQRPAFSREAPLDILRYQAMMDAKAGIEPGLRRGITRAQWLAGAKFARMAWRLFGMPAIAVDRLYIRIGAADPHKPTDPDLAAEREAEDMADYQAGIDACRVWGGGLDGVATVSRIAVYFELPRALGMDGVNQGNDPELRLLRKALDAMAQEWGYTQRRMSA